jgi:membrane-associated phospholipid phosphatase
VIASRARIFIVCFALLSASAAAQTPSSPLGIGDALRGVVHDQAAIWGFPVKAARGSHVKATLPFLAATVALIALDSHDTPYFRGTDRFDTFNNDLSGAKTGLGEGLFPVALLLFGEVRHDSYTTDSAWLAGEALLDTETVTEVSKLITRRLRPSDIPPDGDFGRSWFRADPHFPSVAGFPSGHTASAFALAAVISTRYRDHKWVPWVAYGAATLVGLSRITLQAHFPSDVFVGGMLGGTMGHFVGTK